VFANQGLAFPPYTVERITDSNGDVLEQSHPDPREVENPQAAYQLLQILRGVTQRGTAGPAIGARGPQAATSRARPGRRTTSPTRGSSA
jgi:membrane peptidoglycan carboxypeptidase